MFRGAPADNLKLIQGQFYYAPQSQNLTDFNCDNGHHARNQI